MIKFAQYIAEKESRDIDELLGFARLKPKTTTIKVKRKPEEPSMQDKIKARRKANNFTSGWKADGKNK
jgi:hypothetical protein